MSTEPTDNEPAADASNSGDSGAPADSAFKGADALYLIDGSGFIFRSYHALPKLSTRAGIPTGAVYGFTQMLIKLEQDYHPSHLVVVLDARGSKGFRDELFDQYKANRVAAPEDLLPQFQTVRDVIKVMNVPCLDRQGYEADDIIATLVRRAEERGLKVVIVSSDKDLMQLVGGGIRMVRAVPTGPQRSAMEDKLIGRDDVIARYGVPPELLGDVLALMGDSVDNVPGVPGVGEKTAGLLIRHFGGLSALLDNVDEVPKVAGLRGAAKVQAALREHAEQARLSRKLVALDENVPVELELEAMRRHEPDMGKVEVLFRELEFERLLERLKPAGSVKTDNSSSKTDNVGAGAAPSLFPDAAAVGAVAQPIVLGDAARVVSAEAELREVAEALRAAGEMGVSFECVGSGAFATLVGIGLAADGVTPAYVGIGHRYLGAPPQLGLDAVRAVLGPVLGDARVRKHVHGAKEAVLACMQAGLPIEGIVGDPDLAAYLLEPSRADEKLRSKPLAPIAQKYGAVVVERDGLLGKGKNAATFDGVEVERAAAWSARRAEAVLAVSRRLRPELEARAFAGLLDDMELPLARVLARIECHGIRVDTGHLGTLGEEMARTMATIEREVQEAAGYEVNLGSPKQLQELLFERLQLPSSRKTKTGYSTDAEVLEELAELNPIAARILEHRKLSKLKGTYVDALPSLVNARTGRIHTSFHQTVAGTGRLSSSDPNLQNIPIRSEVGRLIRRTFVADPGNHLIAADYSQNELRILAHLSGDPVLVDAFQHGEDVHDRTAREMFGVDKGEVTSEMRRVSKAINYGLVYGQTDYGLARSVGIPRDKAREYIDAYFKRYAGVARFMESLIADAHRDGGSRTLLGRFRPLPDLGAKNRNARLYAERMARNTPIQGTAADLLKLAMIAADARLAREAPTARMLLTVHDELVLEAPAGDADRIGALVKESMESVYPLRVPLVVEVGSGPTWADC